MTEVQRLRLALLKVAEGLRDELAYGLIRDAPTSVETRIEALSQVAWDALGHPSVQDAERIRRPGKYRRGRR